MKRYIMIMGLMVIGGQMSGEPMHEGFGYEEPKIGPAKGYEEIDFGSVERVRKVLMKFDEEAEREAAMMKEHLGEYNPEGLATLALYLRKMGDKEEAFRVMGLAHIRARIDIKAAQNGSVGDALRGVLGIFLEKDGLWGKVSAEGKVVGEEYVKYFKEHVEALLEMDKKIARGYDLRWVQKYGMMKYLSQGSVYVAAGEELEKIVEAEHKGILDSERKKS